MNTITLPTGRVIPVSYLTFEKATQRAYYGGLDVTGYLTRAQMQLVGGDEYDVQLANIAASDAARIARGETPYVNPPQLTPWDVAANTVQGIGSDLASASESVRSVLAIGSENAGKFKLYLTLGLLGLLTYGLWRAGVFAGLKKKLSA